MTEEWSLCLLMASWITSFMILNRHMLIVGESQHEST
ncbi:unnamed protein product [Brassica oleracea]|uniref:(rape) hypothetical protein n=1 Tax=Brassica napus TaxID=3708 RepID=A0A816VBD4_BRANA|nr:unnamed protein product [Brassica napus]